MTSHDAALARRLLPLLDLTSLNDGRDDDIEALCAKAVTSFGAVAAVCSWADFASDMKARLGDRGPRVAVVVDFPEGRASAQEAAAEAEAAVAASADELDLVMPYAAWLAGETEQAMAVMTAVRAAAPSAGLKVILESGALEKPEIIAAAGRAAIAAGADFLKTSTGKGPPGASPAAAEVLLDVIAGAGRPVGFKASGGVRFLADAALYLDLAERRMGVDWVTADHFRIGASSLLDDLLRHLDPP